MGAGHSVVPIDWTVIVLAVLNVVQVFALAILNRKTNGHIEAHEHAAVLADRG